MTDLSWKSSLIYFFTVYNDESRSYYGNKSEPENVTWSKINFVN